VSTDLEFIAKVHDVIGLYMNPSERALVDEESQIQAPDRTVPILPTTSAPMGHDYVCYGTTSLLRRLRRRQQVSDRALLPPPPAQRFLWLLKLIT
jgi:hypothetical protein